MSEANALRVLGDIPEEKATWAVEVGGELVLRAPHVILYLDNPAKNMKRVIELGWIDDQHGNAYDAIRYWELGGGGTVTIPWTIFEGELWIGVVTQYRMHAGGYIQNAPRGYMKVGGTTRAQNAAEEVGEEMGPKVVDIAPPTQLEGEGVNMYTAVFWTATPGEGNSFHAAEVDPQYLVRHDEGSLRFKADLIAPEGGESIVKCEFIPWQAAVRGRDGLTIVGVARLIAHLVDKTGDPLIMTHDK